MRHLARAVLLAALAAILALPAAASANYRELVLSDNPSSYWRLEESRGPLAANEVEGSPRARYWNHPLQGDDGAFAESRGATTGGGSWVDIGPPVKFATAATYETWVRFEPHEPGPSAFNFEGILELPGIWGVHAFNGNIVGTCNTGPSIDTGLRVADGAWHHVAVRFTADQRWSMWYDGVRHGDASCPHREDHGRVRVGAAGGFQNLLNPLARAVDEVAVYRRALPDDRIQAHAAARTILDQTARPAPPPLTGGPYTREVLADTPFAYYRLDDRQWNPDGTPSWRVEDSSGNGRHSTMNWGGAARPEGPITTEARNKALNPSRHGFAVPQTTSPDITVETWVKHATNATFIDQPFVDAPRGRLQMYFQNGELGVWPFGPATLNDGYWLDKAWHHVVVTKNTETDKLRFYRDGVPIREVTDTDDAPYVGPEGLVIGGGDRVPAGYCLDDVAIYARVLSDADVARHFAAAGRNAASGGCGGTPDVPPAQRPAAPANTSPPAISGIAAPDNQITCDPGEWSGDPTAFLYEWRRDDAVIAAQDGWSYLVSALDNNRQLTCHVTAIGSGGASQRAVSAPASAVGRPLPPGQPYVSAGNSRDGFVFSWEPSPPEPVRADDYLLQRRRSDGDWVVVSNPIGPTAPVNGEPDGVHRYRVIARSVGVESDPSPISDPVIVDRTPPNPARLDVSTAAAWTSPAGVVWYADSISATWHDQGDPDIAPGVPGSGVDPATVPGPVSLTTTGNHSVMARVRDLAGNERLTEHFFRLDAGDPTVTLTCPDLVGVGETASVGVDAHDDAGGSGLSESVPATLPIDTSSAGVRTFSLTVTDNVGHTASDSCDVPVVYPRPSVPVRVAGDSPGDGAVTLEWSRHASAPAPGAYVLEGRDADDSGWTEIARDAAESWSAPAGSPLGEGTWRFRVRIDDARFDATPSGESDPVVVDRTAPHAPAAITGRPADGPGGWFRDSVSVSFGSAGDPGLPDGSAGSDVDPASVPDAVTYSTAGAHTATGTVRDRAGNVSPPTALTVRVDAQAPTLSLICPDTVRAGTSVSVGVEAADEEGGSGLSGSVPASLPIDTSTTGVRSFSLTVTDNVGHSTTDACDVTVMYPPPSAPELVSGSSPGNGAVVLGWTRAPGAPAPAAYVLEGRDADDAGWSEVMRGPGDTWSTPAGAPLAEGTWRFRVRIVDGRFESAPSDESAPVVVDRTAPGAPQQTTDRPPDAAGGWFRDSVTVSFANPGDPGLPDGTPGSGVDPTTVRAPLELSTAGAHRVVARLRDRAGNEAVTDEVVRVDTAAPTLTLTCPELAHVAAVANVAVDASDEAGGSGLTGSVPATLAVDTSTHGIRSFSLTVTDRVGHTTTDSCDVPVVHRRPNAPVLVAGSSPGNGAVTLAWTRHASSPAPAAYVLEGRDANDTGWTEITRGAAESWTAPAGSPLAQGTWRFRVRVDDPRFDAMPSAESDPVVVDRTPPNAPALTTDRPADAAGDWFRDSVTVSFAGAGDPELPDGSAGSGVAPASVPGSLTYSTAGAHTATGIVRDRAGNTSAATSRTLRVDTTAPSAAITCPADPVLQDATATAGWAASDTGSGLAGAPSGAVTLATAAVGTFTVSAPTVRDRVGHVAPAASCTYRVIYDFEGFLSPLVNPTEVNQVDAGDVAPVIFRLNGDRGLSVLAGAPTTGPASCGGKKENVAWTLPSTWSGLRYTSGSYVWAFRTDPEWRNTCRELVVALDDGTTHRLVFRFK